MWPTFIFWGLNIGLFDLTETKRSSLVYTRTDHRLMAHVQSSQWTVDMMACAHLCLAKQSCFSFNFDISPENFGLCELNSEGLDLHSDDIGMAEGWVYGRLEERMRKDANLTSKRPVVQVTFTSLGASGKNGPINTNGYIGTPLEGKVVLNNGIQTWTVPETGNYSIEAWGASGGNGSISAPSSSISRGGLGARVKCFFILNKGTKLKILVGQRGQMATHGSPTSGSGGGGTFVTFLNDTAVAVAGGGGGGGFSNNGIQDGDPGQATENGTRHGGSKGGGGKRWDFTNGEGQMTPIAGGGGGLLEDGKRHPRFPDLEGKSFVNGGVGGTIGGSSWGGFGGGGAGSGYPGGGGGYSGGGVESDVTSKVGIAGGGGSYNRGKHCVSTAGVHEGDGRVEIRLIN